jgi:hypothetical protein
MVVGVFAFVLVSVPVYYAAFSKEGDLNPRLSRVWRVVSHHGPAERRADRSGT